VYVSWLANPVLIITACPHYNRLQVAALAGHGEKRPYGTVTVFQNKAQIPRPYIVVGIMSCEGSIAEEAAILNAMLFRAADLGADAVLLGVPAIGAENLDPDRIDIRFNNPMWFGDGNKRAYRAHAIKFQ